LSEALKKSVSTQPIRSSIIFRQPDFGVIPGDWYDDTTGPLIRTGLHGSVVRRVEVVNVQPVSCMHLQATQGYSCPARCRSAGEVQLQCPRSWPASDHLDGGIPGVSLLAVIGLHDIEAADVG
jgi:hypothetical protein